MNSIFVDDGDVEALCLVSFDLANLKWKEVGKICTLGNEQADLTSHLHIVNDVRVRFHEVGGQHVPESHWTNKKAAQHLWEYQHFRRHRGARGNPALCTRVVILVIRGASLSH